MNIRKYIWNGISNLYPAFLRRFYGMHIGANVRISYKAKLDKSINPKGIHIGDNTWVLADSMVLAHDYCRGENGKGKKYTTTIGANCVIGVRTIIMPGVSIGNHVVIEAGSVVTKDIPDNCMAVGNPAKIIRKSILLSDKTQIVDYGMKL